MEPNDWKLDDREWYMLRHALALRKLQAKSPREEAEVSRLAQKMERVLNFVAKTLDEMENQ